MISALRRADCASELACAWICSTRPLGPLLTWRMSWIWAVFVVHQHWAGVRFAAVQLC